MYGMLLPFYDSSWFFQTYDIMPPGGWRCQVSFTAHLDQMQTPALSCEILMLLRVNLPINAI